MCRWRELWRRSRSMSSSSKDPIDPIAVRIARSSPRARMTLTPVGSGDLRQPPTSTPLSRSAPSMKSPKKSSPTTPMKAVVNPSRAAPHATIAPDPPMPSVAPSTIFSTGQDEVRIAVSQNKKVEVGHRLSISQAGVLSAPTWSLETVATRVPVRERQSV